MDADQKMLIVYGVTCVAIVLLYYNHTQSVAKKMDEMNAEIRAKFKAYEDAVAQKASEQ